MQKFLSELLPSFTHQAVAADGITKINESDIARIEITDIVFDSRNVTAGALFFALPGTHIHGNEFIPQAIENGAAAVIFEGSLNCELRLKIKKAFDDSVGCRPVFLKVDNARFAMSPVSAAFYDHPSEKLAVIGVTGTEGKSSTVSFIWQLLRCAGKKAGFISTVEYSFGEDAVQNTEHQTTPEAPIIQQRLHQMVQNDCSYAVLEASSHGLSHRTNRLGDVLFDCGIFMNVTLEHLEFHGTFAQYRNDKAELFRMLDTHPHEKVISGVKTLLPAAGVVNLEDPAAPFFINATQKTVYAFTAEGNAGTLPLQEAENTASRPPLPLGLPCLHAENITESENGVDFTINSTGPCGALWGVNPSDSDVCRSEELHIPFPGIFNAYNVTAALIAVSVMSGQSIASLLRFVPELRSVKGRMTVIDEGQPFQVIVDYAHTPTSFETILPPLRRRCSGRIFALFGSGGDRDLTKRPLQGRIAARFCDTIILTDEDPRGEDPEALLNMIAEGAEQEGKTRGENLFIIPDRKKAIRTAFSAAQPGDMTLLLGKSHENSIIYKDFVMPYDEIGEATAALKEMGFTKQHGAD